MAAINGFSVVPYRSGALGTFLVPGTGVRLSLRREVAPLLIGLAADFHTTVEQLRPGQCWGHAPKKIAGTSSWSFHAPGIAMDLNATAHPMGRRNTFTPGERTAIGKLLAKYTHRGTRLFRWGGTWKRPDDMHFELYAPRSVCLAAVTALQAPPRPSPPPAGVHRPGSRLLTLGDPLMSGADVEYVQRFIGVHRTGPVAGDYGPRTRDAVRWYQRMRGIADDGDVGRITWRHMGVDATF